MTTYVCVGCGFTSDRPQDHGYQYPRPGVPGFQQHSSSAMVRCAMDGATIVKVFHLGEKQIVVGRWDSPQTETQGAEHWGWQHVNRDEFGPLTNDDQRTLGEILRGFENDTTTTLAA